MPQLLHACLSDAGRRHRDNEDRCFADADQGLYLVSDGMADRVSPQLVVDWLPSMLREALAQDAPLDQPEAVRLVGEVLALLSDRVFEEARQRDEMLGATLVFVLIRRGLALIAHLGDSRAYLLRDEKLEALTRDHSRVQAMIDAGELPGESAPALRRWNGGPTRYVGMPRAPAAEFRTLALIPGDRWLLCSDGLTGELDDESIRSVLARPWAPESMCRELVDRANAAGGHDNITAVVIAVGREGEPAA